VCHACVLVDGAGAQDRVLVHTRRERASGSGGRDKVHGRGQRVGPGHVRLQAKHFAEHDARGAGELVDLATTAGV
jgi:hypothetical protein